MGLPTPKPGTGLNTIAFDGDGVLWAATWPSPSIGEPNWDAIDAAREYRDSGFELVIFTARPEDHKVAIYEWLADYGLSDLFYAVICGKPRYALFWDDRAKEWPEAFTDQRCGLASGQCARCGTKWFGEHSCATGPTR